MINVPVSLEKILDARILIDSVPGGKDLEVDERSVIVEEIISKPSITPFPQPPAIIPEIDRVMNDPTIKQMLMEELEKEGVNLKFIAQQIKEGMNAEKIIYSASGEPKTVTKDFNSSNKFTRLALEAFGLIGNKTNVMLSQTNNLFYKSNLRKTDKPIAVNGPETEVGKRRLAANSRARMGGREE